MFSTSKKYPLFVIAALVAILAHITLSGYFVSREVQFVPDGYYGYWNLGVALFSGWFGHSPMMLLIGGWPLLIAALFTLPILFPKDTRYGDAKWGKLRDARKAGLLHGKGILLGKFNNRLIYNNDDRHVLIAAQSGGGKTSGFTNPNLVTWSDSLITMDSKNEQWEKTAGFRSLNGQTVYLFNPISTNTCSINVFDFVQDGDNQVTDIQRIAGQMIKEDTDKPFWTDSARELFVGISGAIINIHGRCCIGDVLRFIASDSSLFDNIEKILKQHDLPEYVTINLNSFIGLGENTTSKNVIKTVSSSLSLWSNPLIDAATSRSDFDFMDFKKKRISLYLSYKPKDLTDFLSPLYSLIIDFAFSRWFDHKVTEDEPFAVLALLDEFPQLRHLVPKVKQELPFARSYNIRIVPMVQGVSQLEELLRTGAKEFTQNCAHQVYFAQSEPDATTSLSKRLGVRTMKEYKRTSNTRGGSSISRNYYPRALMLPDEIEGLPKSQCIILTQGFRPILADVIHYDDPLLSGRYDLSAPTQHPSNALTFERFNLAKYIDTSNAGASSAGSPQERDIERSIGLMNEF